MVTPFPFEIGQQVTGRACNGAPIAASVVDRTPYSVLLDDGFWTPVSLLATPPNGDIPECQRVVTLEDMLA